MGVKRGIESRRSRLRHRAKSAAARLAHAAHQTYRGRVARFSDRDVWAAFALVWDLTLRARPLSFEDREAVRWMIDSVRRAAVDWRQTSAAPAAAWS
jgi:hypothetical protein